MTGKFTDIKGVATELIKLNDVSVRYGNKEILQRTDLCICRGDFVAITGPNGGGKTTLLRVILRLLRPTTGSVTYEKERLSIGYLPQKNSVDSRFPITVEEVVASGLLAQKNLTSSQRRDLITDAIGKVGLSDRMRQPIGELSGGQLQRALLGRALVSNPEVLVLDEPLSYVDKTFEARLYELLEKLRGKTTILLVSHEMNVIDRMANCHLMVNHSVTHCQALHHGPAAISQCPCNSSK